MVKLDFLQECMSTFSNMPMDSFNKQFCIVCANRDCSRSAASHSVFDSRVASWQDRLFNRVPRAGDDDASYDSIRAKKFLPVVVPGYEIQTHAVQPEFQVIVMGEEPPVSRFMPPRSTPSSDDEPSLPVSSSPLPRIRIPSAAPLVTNTPFQQGAMLEGAPPPPSPETPKGPGASYTFDDEENE